MLLSRHTKRRDFYHTAHQCELPRGRSRRARSSRMPVIGSFAAEFRQGLSAGRYLKAKEPWEGTQGSYALEENL
jgi:hypothetical protein